jgi:hypothetical protein
MSQRSFEGTSSQISQNFLIDQKVTPLPSFVQKAVKLNSEGVATISKAL